MPGSSQEAPARQSRSPLGKNSSYLLGNREGRARKTRISLEILGWRCRMLRKYLAKPGTVSRDGCA
jgi:hypothetical protein